MADFCEIDFHHIGSKKSGDAISIRECIGDQKTIYVVDAGYQETGKKMAENIREYYNRPKKIDHVVVSHPDGDHAGGIRSILESFEIGTLWMLRPWNYAQDLIQYFPSRNDVTRLTSHLKSLYPNIAALEDIATEKGIPLAEPFQGSQIGSFTVTSPTYEHFIDCVVNSKRTPDSMQGIKSLGEELAEVMKSIVAFVTAGWGAEKFSDEETSTENEMSVVQYANILDKKVLLTADTGRKGLADTISFLSAINVPLPGIDKFQVPHHGSRRNINSELLDELVGPKLTVQPDESPRLFSAMISASDEDKDHPRNVVVRAIHHRGGFISINDSCGTRTLIGDAPKRPGWSALEQVPYPTEMED